MKRLYSYLLLTVMGLLPAMALSVSAQLVVEDARGLVGQEVRLPIRYIGAPDSPDSITVSGTLHLSNATVFFPERFVDAGGELAAQWSLDRLDDSTYNFSVTAPRPQSNGTPHDTVALLAGEALAGFDSVCVVTFLNLHVNDSSVENLSGTIITESVGTPLPYVRFATLERNYPNPIRSGEKTTWAYRIDKPSRVIFRFYNIIGEESITRDLGDQPAGIHTFSFTPTIETATGMYIVRMETSTGTAFQFMHVVR